jgi:uncharacterized protein (DUF1330 family)
VKTLAGDWQLKRVVGVKFSSLEKAKLWYNSEAYHNPKALRCKTAKSKRRLVAGI